MVIAINSLKRKAVYFTVRQKNNGGIRETVTSKGSTDKIIVDKEGFAINQETSIIPKQRKHLEANPHETT